MTLIDDIRKDLERGTEGRWHSGQEGPDALVMVDERYVARAYDIGFVGDNADPMRTKQANARRMARVPEMEDALLAADGMREALEKLDYWFDADPEVLDEMSKDELADHNNKAAMIKAALAAYRKAVGG